MAQQINEAGLRQEMQRLTKHFEKFLLFGVDIGMSYENFSEQV